MKKIFKILSKSGDSIKERVIISGFWVAFFKVLERGFRFIKTLIIARLLAPSDFGLFGIACLAVDAMQTFTETGISTALVQKKGNIKEYLNTAWTIQLFRSAMISAVLFLFAPGIARFFNNSQASPLMRVMAINVLFSGFVNIGVVYFQKDIEFGKQRLISLAKLVVSFSVSLILAFVLRNAWALAWGILAGTIAYCVASYIVHPYRPRIAFNVKKAKELIHFGKWVFASSIVFFLIMQGDDILVGKILGTTALGFYAMAYAISNLGATEITHLISQVMFPAYSKLQNNLPKLKETYLKVLQFTALITFPIAGLTFILAPDFTRLFLGEKWMPMVSAMQMLCIFGVIRSIGATMGPIFYSVGKPKIQTKVASIQLIVIALIIYPLTIRWGILGTSLAVTISNILVLALVVVKVKNIINATYKAFFISIIMPVIATFVMFFVMFLKQISLSSTNSISSFFLGLVLCGIIYFAIIYLWDRMKGYKMRHEIYEIFNNLGGKSCD